MRPTRIAVNDASATYLLLSPAAAMPNDPATIIENADVGPLELRESTELFCLLVHHW
jgi:hypothetical protein